MAGLPSGAPSPPPAGLSVAEVLRQFLAGSVLAPRPRAVLRRLSRCHTGQLGWSLWHCEVCSAPHWRPLSCGDRHCPDCTARAREAWLKRQHEALLPVRYYHWGFTLPAVLRPLALQNPEAIYTLLFDSASATLLHFGQERLGVRLGIRALLHTWGQNLMDHPHLHALVTGGGLTADEPPQWRGPKPAQYLFPVRAVAALFAGKFLAGLEELRARGELKFEGRLTAGRDPAVWRRTLNALRGTRWVVFAQGSVVGPEAVLQYLGRYTHRVAISNGRLLRMDERTVTFRDKDYRHGGALREMTLSGAEFVRRLSRHILPPGFTKIRHYGILGNNRRAQDIPRAPRTQSEPAPSTAPAGASHLSTLRRRRLNLCRAPGVHWTFLAASTRGPPLAPARRGTARVRQLVSHELRTLTFLRVQPPRGFQDWGGTAGVLSVETSGRYFLRSTKTLEPPFISRTPATARGRPFPPTDPPPANSSGPLPLG